MADNVESSQERWRMVVVPLFVVMTVGILALGITIMRRRYGLQPGGIAGHHNPPYPNHPGTSGPNGTLNPSYYYSYHGPGGGRRRRNNSSNQYTSLGDLEEGQVNPPRGRRQHQHAGYYGPHGGGGGANRWMLGGRREEGLNELGEAPPPYMGTEGKKGGGDGVGEGGSGGNAAAAAATMRGGGGEAQMNRLGSRPSAGAGGQGAGAAADAPASPRSPPPTAAPAGGLSAPPAYSEAARTAPAGMIAGRRRA